MPHNEQRQEQMLSMIADWQQSGLSQKQYCQKQELSYPVFHYWYKRFKEKQGAPVAGFVPLQTESSYAGHTELYLPDGKRLLFHQPVSVEYLKALIA